MSNFANAMNKNAKTWNGAVSLSSPDSTNVYTGRISLFFKGVRGLNIPSLYNYTKVAANENLVDTFLLAFHLRDPRGGKGERELGRKCLIWLFINYPKHFEAVLPLIPKYGRYDDLLCFFPKVLNLTDINYVKNNFISEIQDFKSLYHLQELQKKIVNFYASRMIEDEKLMFQGKPISLAAKWSPTENDSMDREYNTFYTLAKAMNIHIAALRTRYNTPLRSYLKVVENLICHNKWNEVEYSKVPGHAMKNLRKAFQKHDEKRFNKWKKSLLESKNVKVNAKTLHPHELLKQIRLLNQPDDVLESQWKVLVEETKKLGSLKDTVIVCDTSGSMTENNNLPLDICCALGLLISDCVQPPFQNHIITFSSEPKFFIVPPGTTYHRYNVIKNAPWCMNTNLKKVFEMILERGNQFKLKEEDMPKKLVIVSDMQFDNISSHRTNFEVIDKMYNEYGYKRPQIIFWNVNGSSTDFPVTIQDNGTALMSGASPSILKSIISGSEFNSISVMRKTLDDNRYKDIKFALENLN